MNHTQYFNFPLFESTDKPSWLTDWNGLVEELDNILEEQKELSLANQGEISTFKANLNRISDTISSMQVIIDTLTTDDANLTGRVATLENTLVQVDTEVKSIASRISSINESITRLDQQVGTNTNNILTLTGDVNNVSTQVSQLSSQLTQTQERLDQARRDILSLDNKVDDVKEDLLDVDNSIIRRLFRRWQDGNDHNYYVNDIVYSPDDLDNGIVKIYTCLIDCDGTTPLTDTQCWRLEPEGSFNGLWQTFITQINNQKTLINVLATGFRGSNSATIDKKLDDEAVLDQSLFDVVGIKDYNQLYIFTSDYQGTERLTYRALIQAGRLIKYTNAIPAGNSTYLFDDYKRFSNMSTKVYDDYTIHLAFNPCSLEVNNPKNMIIKPSKVILWLPLGTISANSYVRGNKVDIQFKRKPEDLGPSNLHVLGTATAHLQSDNAAYDIVEIGIDADIPENYIVCNNLLYMNIGIAIPGLTQSILENASVTVECLTKFMV